MEEPLWNKAWSDKYSTRKCYQQQPFNEHRSADFVKQTGKNEFLNDTAWFRDFNYYTIPWTKEIWKPILIFYPKMKILERHLPSFVVLVHQIPVWGPPEAKNGGARPTDPCLPTHRDLRKSITWRAWENGMTDTVIAVYHRLRYLLPGESVKMADSAGSGVSQTLFFKGFQWDSSFETKRICVKICIICCPWAYVYKILAVCYTPMWNLASWYCSKPNKPL